jgi:hypothetical protein
VPQRIRCLNITTSLASVQQTEAALNIQVVNYHTSSSWQMGPATRLETSVSMVRPYPKTLSVAR